MARPPQLSRSCRQRFTGGASVTAAVAAPSGDGTTEKRMGPKATLGTMVLLATVCLWRPRQQHLGDVACTATSARQGMKAAVGSPPRYCCYGLQREVSPVQNAGSWLALRRLLVAMAPNLDRAYPGSVPRPPAGAPGHARRQGFSGEAPRGGGDSSRELSRRPPHYGDAAAAATGGPVGRTPVPGMAFSAALFAVVSPELCGADGGLLWPRHPAPMSTAKSTAPKGMPGSGVLATTLPGEAVASAQGRRDLPVRGLLFFFFCGC